MTFATVSGNREHLSLLSQSLVTAFPGCTIHQSRDPMRTMQQLSSQKVDAVFADSDAYSDLVHILRKQRPDTSVYLLCRQGPPPPDQSGGIRGIVTYPITKTKIQQALQSIPREIREAI